MALTQGAWTLSTVNGFFKATCSVTATTAETDAYTLKTPTQLDTTKPFHLYVSCASTPDGVALPLDIWVGHGDDFVLSGQGASVVATSGGFFKEIFDDIVLAVGNVPYVFLVEPELAVADVVTVAAIATGPKVNVPSAPYYAFNQNGASTLAAQATTYTIIQKQGS